MKKSSINWIDCAKLFACICVVLGHLYMSFMEAGWIDKSSMIYNLPIQTIYAFHVQIFFVCSGFLYQRFRKDTSVKGHFKSALNKFINLGVPYFVFTIITLLLKNVFSGSVNSKATPFMDTLFVHPTAPYWYLYVLFFMFLIIPAVNSKVKLYVMLIASIILKILVKFIPVKMPYIINQLAYYSIWFVLGMLLTVIVFKYNYVENVICIVMLGAGIVESIVFFRTDEKRWWIIFAISVLFVVSLVYLFMWMTKDTGYLKVSRLRKYILPVFLMHTIFAAGFRSVLFKMNVNSLLIHAIVGVIVTFALPMLVYKIVEKKWWLLIFFEPIKAWRMRKE